MIGYFKIIDRKTKEVLDYRRYSAMTDIQKKTLRENPDITLLCACNDKDLEIRISSDLKIYPAEHLVGHFHEARCPRRIDFVPDKL